MRLKQFVTEHRDELTNYVGGQLSHVPRTASCSFPLSGTDHHHAAPKLTLRELADWVQNDEGLYRMARAAGVRI